MIAIISLLVSILIPSLKRAKELTRRVVCSSNLHQIGVALMTYAADHRGEFPEGARGRWFSDFWSRTWKNSVYPKYISVPALCYCPSADAQPDGYVGADPWTYWDYLSYDYCIIGYSYTPNQFMWTQDLQGNVFPTNAEEATSTGVLMADDSSYLGDEGWGGVNYNWNHIWDDAQGGNVMGGDGHVEWKNSNQQKARTSSDSPWGECQSWW